MSMEINPRAAILYAFISKGSFMVAEYEALAAGSGDDGLSGDTENVEERNAALKSVQYVTGGHRSSPKGSPLDLPSLARDVAQARQRKMPHLIEKEVYHEVRGDYLFTFVIEKGVLFLCANLASRGVELPRSFLTELRVRCWSLWDTRKRVEGGNSSRQTLDLTRLLRHMIEPATTLAPPDRGGSAALSTMAHAEETLQSVADVVKENIRKVMDRSEHIDSLVSKACNLSQDASAFHDASRTLRRRLWFASFRRSIIVSILIICICSVVALYVGCAIIAGDADIALCDVFH